MKHVAFFINDFPIPSETFVRTEVKALLAAGHQVSLFCFNLLDNQVEVPKGLTVVCLKHVSTFDTAVFAATQVAYLPNALRYSVKQDAISTQSLLFYGAKLGYLLTHYQCDHLHCHFMHSGLGYAVVGAKWANITVSSIGHGHDVYINHQDLPFKLQACQFTVAVCQPMVQTFERLGGEKIKLLHCGVDVGQFKFVPDVLLSGRKLVFIGRLVEKKGLSYALIALANIAPAARPSLDIIGEGELKAQLMAQAHSLGLDKHVQFLGYQTPDWISQIGQNYHGFLAPFCIADNGDCDTGPVVLKEAMAMGLPVITTTIMGCPEIASPESGYLVAPKNPTAIQHAIEAFCALAPNQYIQMRLAARLRVESCFNATTQGLQLSSWIEQAHL
ncbi:glycosyltransferase [Pseudoalteromonas tunicata]|uniref:glycosyltransferase n=1 Tax=Pseudoalteromonas tunicata TaxID=314281 RepID=UPI002740209F|nr:glycosyltransferase [Pseudoalteromonas tunicata]MDP4985551.1 glycosyltransferase [Pseudoalteromonas tunicata]MDP5212896.1 glycosyltransferase [Pseudoalteromonas tunicata]